ncbi:hypothetical protein, partial [Sutterella wadsworthensis]|uniref:hypothetical protein n=1 Tax=Sutterella wadsworthensis TaxID=40545 RepID=UPI0019D300FC
LMTAESQVISGGVVLCGASKDEKTNPPFGQNVSTRSNGTKRSAGGHSAACSLLRRPSLR